MNSSRPYLVRAIYQWIIDNNATPHLLIDAEVESVVVPEEFIQNGKVILNIGPMAVQSLSLGNDEITFTARFNGVSRDIYCPTNAVLAIYAKENGQGMAFSDYDDKSPDPDGPNDPLASKDKKLSKTTNRPNLRVVK